jgi:hypothetical protein
MMEGCWFGRGKFVLIDGESDGVKFR